MLRPLITQTLNQTQQLRQELIPAQIQSLEILQAPMQELEQKISEILAENPTLELVENGTERLAGNPMEGDTPPPADATGSDAVAEADMRRPGDEGSANLGIADPSYDTEAEAQVALQRMQESWEEYLPPDTPGHAPPSAEEEERRQYRFDSLVSPTTLQDTLLDQFRQMDGLDETALRVGEEIIGSIDDSGYLRSHPADIAIAANADMDEVKRLLAVIQQFDPPGVGARDLRECLMLQLERQGKKNSLEYAAVSKHLDELGHNQIPKVARALRVSPTKVYEILGEIRRLAPYPGSRSEATLDPHTFIVPEVTVSRDSHGNWVVDTNHEYRPRLRLVPHYEELLKDPDTTAEVKSYIRQKIAESRLLLRALENRTSTIERITWSLMKFQTTFFETGDRRLRSLTLTQVAQDMGLHETTIGRAIANKYIQTPYGVFPFRFFFSSGGVASSEGTKISNTTVKQKLAELIRAENPRKPFTDEQLVQQLAEAGINLARRTVAKYREELDILPTHLRLNFTRVE